MMDVLYRLSHLGEATITNLWIPVLIWTVVAIPVLLATRLLGRKRPAAHYYGMLALLGSLLMGFLMVPVWNGIHTILPTFSTPELVLPIEATDGGIFFLQPEIAARPETTAVEATDTRISTGFLLHITLGVITIAVLLWSFISLARVVYQVSLTSRIRKAMAVHEDRYAQNLLADARMRLGVESDVVLIKGEASVVPMTFGWRHPVIVVPEGIENEPKVLEAVLYHELIHVKRKDYLVGVGTRLLASLFRFHPLVWLIDRSIQTYRELSCDNALLNTQVISPHNYAQLLLRFNASSSNGYTIPMIQKKSVIKHRIKAMSEFSPSSFKMNRIMGWSALCFLLFVPAFFMACNIEAEQLEEPYVAPEGATVIDDLKLALMLPEGWWQNGEPVRSYSSDLVEQITPEQLEELKKSDPSLVNGSPDDLQTALYMYLYHNLPESRDSMPENPEEDLFFHMLSMHVHTYYSKMQLARWAKGICGGKLPGQYCVDRENANKELVRVLKPHENPFGEGTGFLQKVKGAELPLLVYSYFVVRDGWAYRISYEITENELGDAPYPPVLDTIGFME